jgi:hypothetical protein
MADLNPQLVLPVAVEGVDGEEPLLPALAPDAPTA